MSCAQRIEIDGRPAEGDELWHAAMAVSDYGHFTAMQVRERRTRGLDLHLRRLDEATRELFGTPMDGARIRSYIRHALGDDVQDASVRVYVFSLGDEPSAMVTVRPPGDPPPSPQRLRSVAYQRPFAHLKHLGGFGQAHHGRLARHDGFDDALLCAPDGAICEAAIANVGFLDGQAVVWPDGPALRGITMQVLERRLSELGVRSRRETIRASDMRFFDGAFATNARGIAAIGAIDDVTFPADPEALVPLQDAYESVEWDTL